jgi:hypothetical protein
VSLLSDHSRLIRHRGVAPLIHQYGETVISPNERGWLAITDYSNLLILNKAVSDGGVHRPKSPLISLSLLFQPLEHFIAVFTS